MLMRRIVTLVSALAAVVLAAGCAAQSTAAGSSDPAASVAASQLSGTWRGWYQQSGGDGTAMDGDVMLEIKDDGTYKLISTRRGSASNDSGVVVGDRSGVTLRSASGHTTRLVRKGDFLYGSTTSSGRHITISVERAR